MRRQRYDLRAGAFDLDAIVAIHVDYSQSTPKQVAQVAVPAGLLVIDGWIERCTYSWDRQN